MPDFLRVILNIVLISSVCLCPGRTVKSQTVSGQALIRIDSFLQSQFKAQNLPGIAIAIMSGDRIIFKKGFGVTNIVTRKPLQPFHNFHVASISKTFTATAVMQLAEKGRIDINNTLTTYLPYFRMKDERYKIITIKQLLNHTSGMPDVDDYEWEKNVTDEGAAERYSRSLADSMLISEPGKEFHYSNIAFDIMADLVAKVSGQSFETYVKKNILLPLGMKKSSFFYPEIDTSLRTSPHTGNPPQLSPVYPYNRMHAPSSTLNTSAEELAYWAMANLNNGKRNGKAILKAATLQEMTTPTFISNKERNVSIGLSWFSYPYRNSTNIEHAGGDLGYRSLLTLIPDKKLGIVLLCNTDKVRIYDIRNGIRDILLDATKE
ncbi:serine hydrolase domain-containing protein [Longitalea arenae]|uniref:serine hydrolase domain-containing protein n=1 Tax=Longitalea arenae TaxID=2812558 RepID=UPI001968546B|nr:serine hydrolase domain-containing protein [Longitalea arenae]